jgi:hypothetical protein
LSRKKISQARLHDLIEREFAATAGDTCLKCRIPMPAYLDAGSPAGANWRLGNLDECSSLCHSILEDIAAKLAAAYDLQRPAKR